MGGVVDGQSVDQAITNPAFLYKNANDTSFVVYTLAAPTSGVQINDVQNTINVLINGVGGTQSNPATAYSGVPSNTVLAGDTLNSAIVRIAKKFFGAASAGGHTHTGVDGDAAPISAVLSIAPTGMGALTGNVVVTGDGKFITIGEGVNYLSIGFSNYGLSDALSVNNVATAGINFNGGAIAGLSYCDWSEAGFPAAYPAANHIYMAASADDHFYAKTSASATRRIDATLAVSGSSPIYGDIKLVQGSGVTLTESGQNITISLGAGGNSLVTTTPTSGAYTLVNTVDAVFSNGASAVVLQASSAATIKPYYIKQAATGTLIIRTNGTDLLDGATTFPGGLQVQYDSITVIPNGASAWYTF